MSIRTATQHRRARRELARGHRSIRRAIDATSTPSMRDELIVIAQRYRAI